MLCSGQPREVHLDADDLVIFTEPCQNELNSIKQSGLFTDFAKRSTIPIQCQIQAFPLQRAATFQCPIQAFPCVYLEMPLSDRRLTKALQPGCGQTRKQSKGMDQDNSLFGCSIALGQTCVVGHDYLSSPSHRPARVVHQSNIKLHRGFLWNNDEIASGGKCLVRWAAICRPVELGGLGISTLQARGNALRVRWL
jgi:hypothetical protein